MKTTYKLLPLSILLGIICFTACREKESDAAQQKPEPESLSNYFNFIKHEKKGSFLFESTGGYKSGSENHAQTMHGRFTDGTLGNTVKGGKVKFGPFELDPVKERSHSGNGDTYCYRIPGYWLSPERHAAKAVFGTTIDIKMEVPLTNSATRAETTTTLSGSLYIPKEIEFLAPIYNELDSSTFTLQEGLHIQWNVDEQNLKGVVIYLEYNPDFGSNIIEYQKKYPTLKYKVINLKDTPDGYTIKNSDLAEFPDGGFVTVRLGRAGFVTLKNGDDNYDVAGYTLRDGEFKVKLKQK